MKTYTKLEAAKYALKNNADIEDHYDYYDINYKNIAKQEEDEIQEVVSDAIDAGILQYVSEDCYRLSTKEEIKEAAKYKERMSKVAHPELERWEIKDVLGN